MVYAATVRKQLVNSMRLHHVADLLFAVVCVTPVKYILGFAFWLNYSMKGKTSVIVWVLALVVDGIVTAMFIALFIFLGSGWAVFRRKLPVVNRLRATVFVTVYLTLSFASAGWVGSMSSSYRLDFSAFYTSLPGITMLVLL